MASSCHILEMAKENNFKGAVCVMSQNTTCFA